MDSAHSSWWLDPVLNGGKEKIKWKCYGKFLKRILFIWVDYWNKCSLVGKETTSTFIFLFLLRLINVAYPIRNSRPAVWPVVCPTLQINWYSDWNSCVAACCRRLQDAQMRCRLQTGPHPACYNIFIQECVILTYIRRNGNKHMT